MLFKERVKLENLYNKWLLQHPEIQDTPFSVISFLDSEGYLKDCNQCTRRKFYMMGYEDGRRDENDARTRKDN